METPTPTVVATTTEAEPAPYVPTAAQLTRAAALRRFNQLYIYLPLTLFALISLALMVLMLVKALPNETSEPTLDFLSGLADIILIGTIVPLWLVASLIPLAAIALFFQMRQKDISPLRGLQILLWRVDSKVAQLQQKTKELSPKAAAPVIQANARLSFIMAWIDQMRHFFRQKR